MSQFGMQMPGAKSKRAASLNVYTGLLFVAVACLVAASALAWIAGSKIAPEGQPWKVQEKGRIALKSN